MEERDMRQMGERPAKGEQPIKDERRSPREAANPAADRTAAKERAALTDRVKMKVLEQGFSHVGVIPCRDFEDYAATVAGRPSYDRWSHGNPESFCAGCFPSRFFPQGKSIICATWGVGDVDYPEQLLPYIGRIYLSRSYVPVPDSMAGKRCALVTEFLESLGMEVYKGKVEVPARLCCALAGIITYGDNNFAYTEEDGSFNVLVTWLVDAELDTEVHDIENGCPPDCHRCMDACPTHAIEAPRVLNAERCILLNDLMPEAKVDTDDLGRHIHGCDICQEVCPRNHAVLAHARKKDAFLEELAKRFDLEKLLFLEGGFEGETYRDMVHPIMYNYIRDPNVFRRNAARAMGNSGDARYLPALRRAKERFAGTMVEGACQHAIEQLEKRARAEQ